MTPTSWESVKLLKVQEEALLRITNNLDQHFTPSTSIRMWIGDNCHQKAAVLLGLLPKEWASKAQGAAAARKRKSKEEGKDKDEDEEAKPGATPDWRGEYTTDDATGTSRNVQSKNETEEPTARQHP